MSEYPKSIEEAKDLIIALFEPGFIKSGRRLLDGSRPQVLFAHEADSIPVELSYAQGMDFLAGYCDDDHHYRLVFQLHRDLDEVLTDWHNRLLQEGWKHKDRRAEDPFGLLNLRSHHPKVRSVSFSKYYNPEGDLLRINAPKQQPTPAHIWVSLNLAQQYAPKTKQESLNVYVPTIEWPTDIVLKGGTYGGDEGQYYVELSLKTERTLGDLFSIISNRLSTVGWEEKTLGEQEHVLTGNWQLMNGKVIIKGLLSIFQFPTNRGEKRVRFDVISQK